MFRTINVFSYGIFKLLSLYPICLKTRKLVNDNQIDDAEKYITQPISKTLDILLKKAGVEINVVGKENIPDRGAFVIIANHQGNFDSVVLLSVFGKRRIGFISKKEIAKITLLKNWMEVIGCSFIDRKSPREAIKSLLESEKIIKGGTPMAFFPEGTRSKSSTVGPFKTGVFKIIEKVKVDVIPVSIEGTYKLFEANNNKIKPGKVNVVIGKPIKTIDYTKDDFKKLPEMLRNIIIENKENIE